MGLIKAQNTPAALAPFSMTDIEQHARGILLKARREADQLLASARLEADSLAKAAHEEGHRGGLEQGLEQGLAEGLAHGAEEGKRQVMDESRAQLEAAMQSIRAAADGIEAHRKNLEVEALREVVQLAAAIARRVTKRQGLIDESVLAANLADAMRLVVHAADLRVAIHPQQRKTLDAALPQLGLEFPALRHVEIVEDDSLTPGGCRVYTHHGRVDADLDVQLDRVIGELLPMCEREGIPA